MVWVKLLSIKERVMSIAYVLETINVVNEGSGIFPPLRSKGAENRAIANESTEPTKMVRNG